MNFIDKVRIFARAGDGGKGCLSFRREKYVPYGGPNGGDGGSGGSIYLEATGRMSTLLDLAHRPHLRATSGEIGKGSKKAGHDGVDTVVLVPVGTNVYKDKRFEVDLLSEGQRYLVARGGRGGRGNASFKTQFRTAPRLYEKGQPGEETVLNLELKLIADVGLVGLPNAGKSTLLSRISEAKPKIADYPFTTLSPNLGAVSHKGVSFVAADVPGLIEGAGQGKGLGIEFLRHVERTRVLVHLIDPAGFQGMTVQQGIKTIEKELLTFGKAIAKKPRLLVVNKMDLPEAEGVLKALRSRYLARKAIGISAATGNGISELLDRVLLELSRSKVARAALAPEAEVNVRKMEKGFEVDSLGGGNFKIRGAYVERISAMLDPTLAEAVQRFQLALKRIGVDRALKSAGIKEGNTVRCGSFEFVWSDAPRKALPILVAKGLSGAGRGRASRGFRLLG